ncbi:putative T-cell immunoglobulin and mucin domain-containing protein 4-like [Scophthalmus maximus]|nr:putative T-cell immunoglobulin and mucin domain-containing protein 4-like [Scophthalmus maximus]
MPSPLLRTITCVLVLSVTAGDDSREVRGQAGHSVTLLCHYDVKTHSLLSVCWNRGKLPLSGCKDLLIAVDQLRVREDTRVSSRYQLWGRLDEGDVSLTILNLTETDAGLYGCRVEIPGWLNDEKHNFHLTVDSAPQTTTTPPVNTETSTHQTTAAHTPGHLTTTGRALTSSSSSISASSSVTAAVGGVVFGLIVMLTAGGVVVVARKWRRLNKVRRQQQLVDTSVQFTCGGSAAENIYQIDGGEYEFCP